uniref:CBS domain-containing protein n=1 Tax=Echinostoma caproni TaxID=27848 RepID=A0A183BF20_9TREM
LRRVGLPTLGSVLVCNLDSLIATGNVRCAFPPRPWRTFQPLSEHEAREAVQQAVRMQNRVSAVSMESAAENPEAKFSMSALDNLKTGAMSTTNDEV